MSWILLLWIVLLVAWTVGLLKLARWMSRREAEAEDLMKKSTLTDEERAQVQLGIALTAGNTFTSPH